MTDAAKCKPTLFIALISAALLAGCGKSATVAVNEETAATAEQKETEVKEPEAKEEVPKGVPNLLLFREKAYEWRDDKPALKQHFTYIMLDGESKKSNAELAASLEAARDEMFSQKKEQWDKDLKSIEENGLVTIDDSWKAYLRRADEKYLSFVTEYSSEGLFDDGAYTEYTAHSYYVDGGKEIAFSDVVANEDAFFDLLGEKMYESIANKLKQNYSTEIGIDRESFKKDLKGYISSGELAWTLDPYGVTCYLRANMKAPFAETATIQFSEDADKTIFTDEFRDSAKNEYVIQIPGYVGSYVDINDSGVPSYVKASELFDYKEEIDEFYLSGLYLSSNGDVKNIPATMPGGTDFYNIFLIHKDSETAVIENHDEYDRSYINTYVIARHEITAADSIRGCLEWASRKDYDINGEGYTPVYIPTDPSNIRVLTGEGEFAGDWSPAVIQVEKNGKIAQAAANMSSDTEKITKDQAIEAIKKYCFKNNPDLEAMSKSDEYTIYWDASVSDSGETYTTELVPGITDEEQKTDEKLNVKDYL